MSKRRQRRLRAKDAMQDKKAPEKRSAAAEASEKPKQAVHPKSRRKGVLGFYENNIMKLMLIPFLILFLAFAQIGYQYATTGDIMSKGVSLKGGMTLTIPSPGLDAVELQEKLDEEFPGNDIAVRSLASASLGTLGLVVEVDIFEDDAREMFTDRVAVITGVPENNINIDSMGPSLGESFFRQTFIAMIVAFLLMGFVVLLYFRTLVPSLAIILSAFSDIVVTLAIMNLLGIKITAAGIAAFLMLIGYSIDSDILLTTRVLKNKYGDVFSRIIDAGKTGLTMSFSTIAAVTAGLFISQSEVLSQIMTIILIGLLVDLMNTWLQNVGLLRWYVKRKGLE